mmetsp:Transcript_73557/g.227175  ORF Transcript_73557/g.227175 Transcript_73557/m.227175 type:complete len:222 (+) Transcript_73557:136-801(+)|eukprot:CAMPEP_0204568440 /NCGR_PEP_ID=MMETSP0661-20131031/37184_1 /ASSEMBLY_ACC=CAM_ASM_000606 /TAXON_ID=109239 /ORGANISM="Alexandrium margalefi, Strain AMGDE01CS-322" /LENGTH=221 /DNA_ID=CAMNT_0051576459 /DNA_START=47 /DNA_END=712 /DNA_ORIENTATION=+
MTAARLALPLLLGIAARAAQPMSDVFPTLDDLERADGVCGVSWAELQRRCAPGAGPGQTQGGWISDGTPIREVLERDWATVAAAGTTHRELAAHLDAVWAKGRVCDYDHQTDEIGYDVRSVSWSALPSTGLQRLKITCAHTRGIQSDLINPDDWFQYGWNVDWSLSSGHIKLRFGGRNSSSGIVQYIREFGFYEGGEGNDYRVDPAALIKLLTGTSSALEM